MAGTYSEWAVEVLDKVGIEGGKKLSDAIHLEIANRKLADGENTGITENMKIFLEEAGFDVEEEKMGRTIAEIIATQKSYNPNTDYKKVYGRKG